MTRKLLPLLLLALSAPAWGAYAYRATITLAQTTGASDLTNFTSAVYISDASLKLVANSGQIQHTVVVNGATCPADFIVTSDSNGSVPLNYACEAYDGSAGNGKLWFHVKKTTSHTATTTIYAFWGNSAVTTFQGGAIGSAWDAYTLAVIPWNVPGTDSNGSGTLYDFSTLNNNGTYSGDYAQTTGPFGPYTGGITSAPDYLPASASYRVSTGTFSIWVNPQGGACSGGYNQHGGMVGIKDGPDISNGIVLGCDGVNSKVFAYTGKAGTVAANDGTVTLSASTWYHIAVAFVDGGTSTLYVNGSAAGTFTAAIGIPSSTGLYLVYGTDGGPMQSAIFLVDHSKFDSVMRSADWIAAEYSNFNAPATFAAVSGVGTCSGSCGAGTTATTTMTPIIM
jgi:hypothetical protein